MAEKAYLLQSDRYLRYDVAQDRADAGYPKPITGGWSGLTGTGFERDIDSALDLGSGHVYLFNGENYLRINQSSNAVDGPVRSIAENWGGFRDAGFADSVGAAMNWGNGKAYLFKEDRYISYDIVGDRVDGGHPAAIADGWPGLAAVGFADSIDAAVNWGNGKAYFFKGESYVRFDIAQNNVDSGYPMPIADHWTGLQSAGFSGSINAIWLMLTTAPAPSPVTGGLAPGDHVWYYNGLVSTDQNIPRAAWFKGSASETDYCGHGEEIFNFVIHAGGEIKRGRPHMKNHEGTHAWLNNNPGNLTGVPGGKDWGQYRDKFNWHNFLIFPSYDVGYAAIAALLRQGGYPAKTRGKRTWPAGKYSDLGIVEAFHRYAPEDDGNNPEQYGRDVAQAAGVPTSTLISQLDDAQMRLMQDKIVQIEGSVPGATLTIDSPELPNEIRQLLRQG